VLQHSWSAWPQGEHVPPIPITAPTQVRVDWQFSPAQQAMPLAPQLMHIPARLAVASEQPSPALQVELLQHTWPAAPHARQRSGNPARVVAHWVPCWQSEPLQQG
jgi:hypothetical protein